MIGQPFISELCVPLSAVKTGADVQFSSVSIDTRTLEEGALFVAICGPNFDGHDYLETAMKAGAVAALVSKPCTNLLPQLQVTDTRIALGRLGGWVRSQFTGAVAAVTGSCGKTTVKSLLTAILAQKGAVHATRGNLNNDFGAPLTLCELASSDQSAVIELGASAIGEIAYTVAMTKPHCGIITNASIAHLDGFGSLQAIATAKGEIISGLDQQGVAILNRDDDFYGYWCELAGQRKISSFGLAGNNVDFGARNLEISGNGSRFELATERGNYPLKLALSGRHNVINALAAAAAASACGIDDEMIVAGLESARPLVGRGESITGIGGARIIDDSYNANPASFRAAIDLLAECQGETLLVVGDMAELGSEAIEAHRQLGEYARLLGVDALLAVGPLSAEAARAYGAGAFSTLLQQELIGQLKARLGPQVTVLVKGSRSARMDQVVEAVREETNHRGKI